MIPLLVEKFGLERVSYCLGIFAQCVYPLAFLYANDKKINPVETSLIRGILLMVINFAIIRYYDMGVDFKYDVTWWNLFKRNGIVVIHGLAITAAQFFLPLPIVHTINFFAPIFIFIIDYFENGVRINRAQFISLMVGVLGIITTLNDELVAKLMDPEYEMKTDFKNYISLDPTEFTLYGLALIGVMFLWAYGLLRVRMFYKNNHTHTNFHLGICFIISSAFLYPFSVTKKSDLTTLAWSVIYTGLPLTIAQLCVTAALAMNRKSVQIIILTGIPVFIGYLLSYYRYEEVIKPMEALGSCMILVGLLGVINCG